MFKNWLGFCLWFKARVYWLDHHLGFCENWWKIVVTPQSFALSSFSIYQWYFLGVLNFRHIHLDRPNLDWLNLRVCRSDSSCHVVYLNHHVDCLELREDVPYIDCFHVLYSSRVFLKFPLHAIFAGEWWNPWCVRCVRTHQVAQVPRQCCSCSPHRRYPHGRKVPSHGAGLESCGSFASHGCTHCFVIPEEDHMWNENQFVVFTHFDMNAIFQSWRLPIRPGYDQFRSSSSEYFEGRPCNVCSFSN